MPKDLSKIIGELIAQANKRGYVTFDEIDAAMPANDFTSEEIETVLVELQHLGVTIRED